MDLPGSKRQSALLLALLLVAVRVEARPFEPPAAATARRFAFSQGPSKQATPPAQLPRLEALAWLAGHWIGKWGQRTAEQVWMAPQGGLMVGTFRLFEDDQTLLVELFTVKQDEDGLELRFRHFTPDLVPWEKSSTAVLILESIDAKKIVFTNPANGEPKHTTFIRVDDNTYISRSEVVSSSGARRVVDITFHRQEPPASLSRHR